MSCFMKDDVIITRWLYPNLPNEWNVIIAQPYSLKFRFTCCSCFFFMTSERYTDLWTLTGIFLIRLVRGKFSVSHFEVFLSVWRSRTETGKQTLMRRGRGGEREREWVSFFPPPSISLSGKLQLNFIKMNQSDCLGGGASSPRPSRWSFPRRLGPQSARLSDTQRPFSNGYEGIIVLFIPEYHVYPGAIRPGSTIKGSLVRGRIHTSIGQGLVTWPRMHHHVTSGKNEEIVLQIWDFV